MDNERQLLALLTYKQELIPLVKIKPNYLSTKELQDMLMVFIDSYKQYNSINTSKYLNRINIELYTELITDEIIIVENWKDILKNTQDNILEDYKKRALYEISDNFKNNKIGYEDFLKKVNDIKELKLDNEINYLTEQEIMQNITLKNKMIRFNKFPVLQKRLNLVEGDLLIIGSTTGGGKSAFLLNLLATLAGDYQCIYFNLEMSKTSMYRRLLGITSEQRIKDIDNPTDKQKSIFRNAVTILSSKNIIFEHQKFFISDIQSTVALAKDVNKHTIVFIDHIGLLKARGFKSLYEQMTEISKQLRQISLNYDCTIICASQLNRGAINSEELNIGMLKDSGEIENSARKVILIYPQDRSRKDDLEVLTNIEIAKNDSGSRGVIEMIYDKTRQIFTER